MIKVGDTIEFRALYSHTTTFTVLSFYKDGDVDMVELRNDCNRVVTKKLADIIKSDEYTVYRKVDKEEVDVEVLMLADLLRRMYS